MNHQTEEINYCQIEKCLDTISRCLGKIRRRDPVLIRARDNGLRAVGRIRKEMGNDYKSKKGKRRKSGQRVVQVRRQG